MIRQNKEAFSPAIGLLNLFSNVQCTKIFYVAFLARKNILIVAALSRHSSISAVPFSSLEAPNKQDHRVSSCRENVRSNAQSDAQSDAPVSALANSLSNASAIRSNVLETANWPMIRVMIRLIAEVSCLSVLQTQSSNWLRLSQSIVIAQFAQETCRTWNSCQTRCKCESTDLVIRSVCGWYRSLFGSDFKAIDKRRIFIEVFKFTSLKPWKVLRECSKNDHLVQAIIRHCLSSCLPPVYQFDNSFIIRTLFGKHCLEDRSIIELLCS